MGDKRDNRKSEIFKIILKILGSGVLISAVFLFPGSGILLNDFLRKKEVKYKSKNFREALRRVHNKKLIKIIEKDGQEFLEITELGRKELLRYNIDELSINKSEKWDGKWRMVIFDIPEKYGEGRRALSKKLKELGFYRLQKSVFIYPYECENEIDFIREFFGVKKFVILLRVSTINEYHDLIIKKYFNLL